MFAAASEEFVGVPEFGTFGELKGHVVGVDKNAGIRFVLAIEQTTVLYLLAGGFVGQHQVAQRRDNRVLFFVVGFELFEKFFWGNGRYGEVGLLKLHRRSIRQHLSGTSHDDGGRKFHGDDRVGTELERFVDHTVVCLLAGYDTHFSVGLYLAADDALQARADITANVACADGVAFYDAQDFADLAAGYVDAGGDNNGTHGFVLTC